MRKQLTKIALVATFGLAIIFTSCGPSAAEVAIRSAPSLEAVKGLKDKFIWLEGNAQSGGNYIIELDKDEQYEQWRNSGVFTYELYYKNKSDITITLRGIGATRTIQDGYTLRVGSGVKLILDNNIKLQNTAIMVRSGGTLVMNDGSTITGGREVILSNSLHAGGGGVGVYSNGTFIMKGGTISNNRVLYELEDKGCKGAGVYVHGGETPLGLISGGDLGWASGTFIKTGGTITGYASDPENGNAVTDIRGNAINGRGHAVCIGGAGTSGREPIAIDTTIGPETTLHFRDGKFKEGRK